MLLQWKKKEIKGILNQKYKMMWEKRGKINEYYILRTKEGSVNTKKVVVATNGFYQEGLVPQMNSRILPVISNIIVTRKLTKDEIDLHNFKNLKTFSLSSKLVLIDGKSL